MADVESVIKDIEVAQEEKPPEDSSIQRGGTPVSADVSLESKSSESVIDYAKNTMNSFLSMYGYEESMTTEALKSKIKCEPMSPSKEKKHSYSAEVISAHITNIKTEEVKKDVNTTSARTATVMPIQSTSKTERVSKADNPSNIGGTHNGQGSKGAVGVPRKPITPYMRYRNMIFEEIKHKYPGCSPYDLACLISSKWSMLTDSERKVWEDQYEQEMRDYSVNLKEYSETLKKIFKSTDPASPAAVVKGSSEENKAPVRQGTCNWCKKATVLLDFSSVLEGREIYCTGLCSEKCFTEAAKQILSIENGNNKPRYVSGNRASQSREDPCTTSFAAIPQYSTVTNTDSTQAPFQVFDWDPYLIETQSSAAPWLYFKQSRYPPPNNFVVGMKLEACNGQTIPGYSLATVVSVCGARILLHFDGSDTSSDIWRLPDSGDIHPVGWTEASQLKPPSGYKYDYSKYRRFHASSLQNAEIAPARLFKKEPTTPIENYFITGMKLEAVNKQSPSIIGVATITDVDEERIRIEFDTCKGLGYWCHYSDRDLFPAGWCSRSGHPLKPPGSSDSKSPCMIATQGSSSPSMVSTASESRSNTGSPYVIYPSPAPTAPRETTWKDKNASGNNNVEIFINTECYCGPYLDCRKVQQMQHVYRGSIVTVLKSVLEDTVRCAVDSKTVFGFLKPGRGNCVITATCDGMTYQCCLNSIDRVSTFWRVLEQFSDNLRCCSNLFSSVDYRQCCNRCNRSKSSNIGSELQVQLGKRPATPSGYSSNKTRRTDSTSTNNELHKQSSYEPSSYVSVYDASRDESDVVQPRQDSLHRETMLQESLCQDNLRQDSLHQDSLHQESLRQDILRQDSMRQDAARQDSIRQDTLRQDLKRQDSIRQDVIRQDSLLRQESIREDASLLRQESIRQDSSLRQESIRQDSSLRQESMRQDTLRQESMRKDSIYESMRQENFSNQLPKEDNIHHPVTMESNYDNEREMQSGDGVKPLEKRKKEEQNEDLFEVNGVEISTAPKSWSIEQVIAFIQQTDLRENIDKFKDNEIDGKALLLLQRDLVLSHMGFKLGPAVKLLDLIEELKIVQGKFR